MRNIKTIWFTIVALWFFAITIWLTSVVKLPSQQTFANWLIASVAISVPTFLALRAHYNRLFRRSRSGKNGYKGGYTNHTKRIWCRGNYYNFTRPMSESRPQPEKPSLTKRCVALVNSTFLNRTTSNERVVLERSRYQ